MIFKAQRLYIFDEQLNLVDADVVAGSIANWHPWMATTTSWFLPTHSPHHFPNNYLSFRFQAVNLMKICS